MYASTCVCLCMCGDRYTCTCLSVCMHAYNTYTHIPVCSQPCPPGTWGLNCVKVCICNNTNSDGCNPQDGTCNCRPGYEGSTCDMACPPGYFGNQCSGQLSVTCVKCHVCPFVVVVVGGGGGGDGGGGSVLIVNIDFLQCLMMVVEQ